MHVWLTHVGETLPIDGPVRLFRYGILAEMLVQGGHQVTRWAPTFVHATKTFRARQDQNVAINDNYRIELLHAGGYRRHIGLRRLIFTKRLAKAFERKLRHAKRPDIIVAGLPSPEMCDVAVQFGEKLGIPVVVDVRDLWPHIFVNVVPAAFRPAVHLALTPLIEQTRRALREATALYAVSRQYLQWGLENAGRHGRNSDRVHYLGYQKSSLNSQERLQAEKFWRNKGITSERSFRCCYFGSINSTCDITTVVQAARMMASLEKNTEFVICGQGPKLHALQQAAAELDNVVFAGWVNQPEIAVLLDWSDVGLATYSAGAPQSIPNKPIEYLSAGLPVLSSLQGEFAQMLQNFDCGRQYHSGDIDSFTAALRELQALGSKRAAMRARAAHLFQQHFDASHVYPRFIDDLAELVRQGSHSRVADRLCA